MRLIRILLVDDSPEFLDSAAELLSQHPHVQVVGRAQCGSEAVSLAQELSPDLVLMDLAMPVMNGLQATQEIKARSAPRVVIVTLHDNVEYRRAASTAGADGFIPKEQFGDAVLALIDTLFPAQFPAGRTPPGRRPHAIALANGAGVSDADAQDEYQRSVAATVSIQTDPARGRILVVDDLQANRDLLIRLLHGDGHLVFTARDGEETLELVAREQPDLVLLDVMMPRLNGFETCRMLKRQASTRLIPVVLITALSDSQDRIQGIEAGADDFLTKPFNQHELQARVRSLLRIKRYTDDLDTAESVIMSLALTIEARDRCTDGHCQRLAGYATALGRDLGLSDDDVAALERGGFLHDVGKIGIPDAVLLKAGQLTPGEYEQMKQHTIIGDRLCGELRSLRRVRPIVRHHHERLDGSGYPDGLRGESIPLTAQITGVVDVFDAMTTARPYKAACLAEHAYQELEREVDLGWRRRDLVDAFIRLARQGRLPSGTTLRPTERAGHV